MGFLDNFRFNYVDLIFVALLVAGIIRGRKRGMSEELLTFLQWLIIIFVGGIAYEPLGQMLASYTPLSLMTCYVITYLTFAVIVKLVFLQTHRMLGEKLVGSNFFGPTEYYLGMLAGMVRFGCMALMAMALFNARLITTQERAATAKMQSKNFEGISFPTFGSIQQSVLFESFIGSFVTKRADFVLIRATESKNVPLRRNDGKYFNEVIDKPASATKM